MGRKCTQRGFLALRLTTSKLGARWTQLVCGKRLLSQIDCHCFEETNIDNDVNLEEYGGCAWAVVLVSSWTTSFGGVFATLESAITRVQEIQTHPSTITKKQFEHGASFQIRTLTIVDERGEPSSKFPVDISVLPSDRH